MVLAEATCQVASQAKEPEQFPYGLGLCSIEAQADKPI
jgi:hypothetical protein